MVFSSLFFLYVFLPLNLLLYHLMPSMRAKNAVMLIFSLIFYAWGEPVYVLLLIGMAFADWALARWIGKQTPRSRRAKWGVAATCIVDLGILGVFKYGTFFMENTHNLLGFPDEVLQIALPIGISFYTFQLRSYVVDVYRGEVAAQKSFPALLLYVSLFHQCIAGPIVRYKDINAELLERHATRSDISYGVTRFTVGLAKKAVLANACGALADQLLVADTVPAADALGIIAQRPVLALWVGVLAFMLQIYLDFSAYSDMAIGMGRMIGFHYRENFNYPYISVSITDFWRRWHPGRQPAQRAPGNLQPVRRLAFDRLLARRQLELRVLGPLLLCIPGAGAGVPARRAGACARLLRPRLRAGGGLLRLGAVQVHRFFRAGHGPFGHVRRHRRAPFQLRGGLADPEQSAHPGGVHRGLHAHCPLAGPTAL